MHWPESFALFLLHSLFGSGMNLELSEICQCWLPHPVGWCSSVVEAVFSHTRLLALTLMLKSLLSLGQPRSLGMMSRHFSSVVPEHFAIVQVFPEKDELDELGEVEGSVWVVETSACSTGNEWNLPVLQPLLLLQLQIPWQCS